MSSDTTSRTDDEAVKGWDKDAFWYPTLDRRGALLGLLFVLLVLHFNEIFGLHTSRELVFGWLPVNMAYYVGLNVLHVGFLVLIYLTWPMPTDREVTRPGPAAAEGTSPVTGTEEGE